MKILLINSDLAVNRGDRAIAAGLLALLRDVAPGVDLGTDVTLISQHAARDARWYGTRVLAQGIHSLNPLHWWALGRAARASDLVLWGGGELLKDYTNRLGVWYWTAKIAWVRAWGGRVVGVFQGIGPTTGASSRRLIASTVRHTRAFVTRDATSRDRLESWGVPAGHVRASFDSAVYAAHVDHAALPADVAPPFERYAVMAPRQWFHYRRGGWLPARWRRPTAPSPDNVLLRERMVAMIDDLVDTHGAVVLLPMHMDEDPALVRQLAARAARPDRVAVIDDDLSPEQIRAVMARADLMVAFRLHAGIIATSVDVPTLTYYYVDKGRLYAEQVGASAYTRPIEKVLEADAMADFRAMATAIVDDGEHRDRVASAIERMRVDLREALTEALTVTLDGPRPQDGRR